MEEKTWTEFKSFIASRSLPLQWSEDDVRYYLSAYDGPLSVKCWIHKTASPDAAALAEFEADYKAGGNASLTQTTTDRREIIAINRIPAGYTIYPIGKSDGVTSSPGYRTGTDMILDANNKTRRFQMKNHWYGIGGRVLWEGADLSDSMSAYLKAPATTGLNQAGDYNKSALGGGANVYVPAAPGTGAWSLDLTAKHTGTQVLKCVPVPVAGNTGFFDYNSDTNTLTANASQLGGYNLYDFDATLFCMASHCWGRKQDGAESSLEIPDVIGKLFYNCWVLDFTLTTEKTSGIRVGLVMIAAVKSNV